MTEAFLHYLWQYRQFNMTNLRADNGSVVEIVRPGSYNSGSGPDFFNAQLRIDGTLWAGNVEIHIRSSDWRRHAHHLDAAYDNCILHVVFENDEQALRTNGTSVPAVELKGRFPGYLWENYLKLIGTGGWVACQPRILEIDENTWSKSKEKMILERVEQKSSQVLTALKALKDDWEECFYQHLSRNFGFRLNALPFEMLARSLPYKIILKERGGRLNAEALLFGQAGMLETHFTEDYPLQLKEKYLYLAAKYNLRNLPVSSWKFLRLRPVNFPTVRIAQLACLLSKDTALFRNLTEIKNTEDLFNLFDTRASEFWDNHYTFKKSSVFSIKKMGAASVNNILINTCTPFIHAWGRYTGNSELVDWSFALMKQIPPEENRIVTGWETAGVKVNNAVDTQSLIQLYSYHCTEKKCLSCIIGNRLINTLP